MTSCEAGTKIIKNHRRNAYGQYLIYLYAYFKRFKNPAFRRGGMDAGTQGLALLLCLLLTLLRLALLLLRLVLGLLLRIHVENGEWKKERQI
jgi:hypothetical protein